MLCHLPVAVAIAFAVLVSAGSQAQVVAHPDPLAALASDDPALAANKRLVFDLWRGIVNGGHVELADELLAEDYTQHSPVLPTGRAAFKQIFSTVPRRDEIPELVEPPLVAIVAEGDLVAMVLVENLAAPAGAGRYTSAHFNLFRVDSGRLAEHWHSVQTAPGPEVAAPEDGGPQLVTGLTGTVQYALLESQSPDLAANKRLVFDAWRQIVAGGREALVDVYLDGAFVSHNPNVAPGRDGFRQHIAARGDRPLETGSQDPLVAVVAEGDLVVQVSMREHPHPVRAGEIYTTTWFDMFRIADGKIAEHWDPDVRILPDPGCLADGALEYICNLDNAEDIVSIGASRWLVASNLNRRGQTAAAGKLYLIDAAARTAEEFFPGPAPSLRHDLALFGDCEGIDLAAFDTHGLAIRATAPGRYRLYATSHGANEAIQVFEIDATRIAGADASAALQDVSTALAVGGELWLGTAGGDRVGYLDVD